MFTGYTHWPRAILHLDADAFFASVMQAAYPQLKGKPVVVGRERGIATAISYEARSYGVKRGMLMHEVRKMCPQCVCVDSDFELIGHYANQMFEIVRRYSPTMEEYSIDEGFADLAGMRRPLRMSYEQIAHHLQDTVEKELGISVSVGISLTKSLAKIASSSAKPHGVRLIKAQDIESVLQTVPIHDVWGIGRQTGAYLTQLGIHTAHELTRQSESFLVHNHLTKPTIQIWQELRGEQVFPINPNSKDSCKSISRTQTFSPTTSDKNFLLSRIIYHVEDAFRRSRTFGYSARKLYIFIKTNSFKYQSTEIKLPQQTQYPLLIREQIHQGFERIYNPHQQYRSAGATITDFHSEKMVQDSLFTDRTVFDKWKSIYPLFETKQLDFGSLLWDKSRVKARKPIHSPIIKARFF